MKRTTTTLALIGLMCLTTGVFAEGILPDGHYRGSGHWTGPDGSSGEYEVETVIAGDVIESTYRYPDAQPGRDKHTVQMTVKDDGSLEVASEKGKLNGRGYHLDDECFYRMEASGLVIEENIRLADGKLIKFGSKSGHGFLVVWKEILKLD